MYTSVNLFSISSTESYVPANFMNTVPREESRFHLVSQQTKDDADSALTWKTVINYPKFAREVQDGAIVDAFCSVMDICPTILNLAGITHPAANAQSGRFRDRDVVSMRGKSWVCIQPTIRSIVLFTNHCR